MHQEHHRMEPDEECEQSVLIPRLTVLTQYLAMGFNLLSIPQPIGPISSILLTL